MKFIYLLIRGKFPSTVSDREVTAETERLSFTRWKIFFFKF